MKRILLTLFLLLFSVNSFAAWLPGYTSRQQAEVTGTATSNTNTPELELYYRHAKIVEDGVFEWFMSTAIRHVNTYDRVYFTYLTETGNMCVRYFDEDTQVLSDEQVVFADWSYETILTGKTDDHGCGTTHVIQNGAHAGKFLVAAAEHNGSDAKGGRLHVRRSTNVEDITSWETAVEVQSVKCSYVQVFENSAGTIYLFTREQTGVDYTTTNQVYYTSTDGGSTWSSSYTLFADLGSGPTYLMTAVDGNTIHFLLNHADSTTTPDAYRYKDIYYAKSTDGMATIEKADGTAITLPITTTNGDLVHTTVGTHWEFLWDIIVDDSGNPHLMSLDSATMFDSTSDVSVFHHSYSSGWSTETVLSTGAKQVGDYPYFCGAVFEDGNPDVVYASIGDPVTDKGMMQKWEKDGTWSKTLDITTDSPGDSFRPMAVHNAKADGLFKMLWCYTERYVSWEPLQWSSSLFAYPSYNNQNHGQLNQDVRTDFGDVRFTQSDGTTLLGVDGKGFLVEKTDSWKSTWEVKLPTIDNFYIYSGNASSTYPADDTSEFEAVYGFDNFPGTSIDLTKWTVEATYSAPTVSSNEATYSNGDYTTTTTESLAIGERTTFDYKTTSTGIPATYIAFLKSDASNRIQVTYSLGEVVLKSTVAGVDQTEVSLGSVNFSEYRKVTIERAAQTSTMVYIDNVLLGEYTENTPAAGQFVGFLNVVSGQTNTYANLKMNEPIRPNDYDLNILSVEQILGTNWMGGTLKSIAGLDTVKYWAGKGAPVVNNCTGNYGTETVGASNTTGITYAMTVHRVALSCGGTIDSISGYLENLTSSAAEAKMIIYSDDGSGTDPDSLLYEGTAFFGPTDWFTDSSIAIGLTGEPSYVWIGFRQEFDNSRGKYDAGGDARRATLGDFTTAAPATWPTGSDTPLTYDMSFYITFP